MWWPEQAAWLEFEELVDQTHQSGQSLDWFAKQLRILADKNGWSGALPVVDRQRFYRFALGIYRRYSSVEYARHRLSQLREGSFRLWIYRLHDPRATCAERHIRFDGLALPPEHLFWSFFFPPNDPECQCRVGGTSFTNERGIRRMGGDPDKCLPVGWMAHIPEAAWRGANWPDLQDIFAEALRDLAE